MCVCVYVYVCVFSVLTGAPLPHCNHASFILTPPFLSHCPHNHTKPYSYQPNSFL